MPKKPEGGLLYQCEQGLLLHQKYHNVLRVFRQADLLDRFVIGIYVRGWQQVQEIMVDCGVIKWLDQNDSSSQETCMWRTAMIIVS